MRTFRVSRIRSDIRFATRRERDFRLPPEFDIEAHRVPRPWQIGDTVGTARIRVQDDTAWWVHRTLADAGSLTDGVFETPFSRIEPLAGWVLRQNGRAIPLEPKALRDAVAEGLARLREGHDGESPVLARERRVEAPSDRGDRPVGPIAPERFGVLQALLAHVLSACGEGRDARLDADDLAERFSIPREELQETLSLLNLVNFGGGCYTVYAEVDEDAGIVRVDKELYGDVFRRPPRLTPLEARAISLAIDYVGPTIAAESHTTLDRVRKKLEETFGQFDVPQTLSGESENAEEKLVRTLSDAVEKRRVVEIEYLKEGDETPRTRAVEPYSFVRELPHWRVHTWDRTVDGPRTYRLDRMRSARLTDEQFEPREGFDPEYMNEPRLARVWHSPVVARWKLERGARLLTDKAALVGAALQDRRVASLGGARRCRRDGRARAGRHAGGRRCPRPRAAAGAGRSVPGGSARQHEPERRSRPRGRLDLDLSPMRLARSHGRPPAQDLSPAGPRSAARPARRHARGRQRRFPLPRRRRRSRPRRHDDATLTVTTPSGGE